MDQSKQRILVVDDQPSATTVLAYLLEKMGFETCAVNDSRKVLRAAREFAPQIILLDISMPYMDGYEVARRLRLEPIMQEVPIIAVTSYSNDDHKRRAADAGIDHQLTKPCDLDDLTALIVEVARKSSRMHPDQPRGSCDE